MRRATLLTFLAYFILTPLSLAQTVGQTQTAPQRDPQALALATQSVQAIAGATALTDATLQGTAEYIAGSDDETGGFTLEVKGNQESKLALNLSGGERQEIRQGATGAWVGADSQKHTMAIHNCLVDASWLFPIFTLQAAIGNQQVAAAYLGQTTLNGVTVDHLQLSYVFPGETQSMTVELQNLSAMDIYLDAASHLPVALDFNTHPDSDFGVSIPVEIQFSGYQQMNGVQAPIHIQKFIQGTLTVDLRLASVAINSGIPDSEFNTN